ncbi:uncharacterized protein FFNC_06824 [Fusarium fujikuroi]|nr:uncharacterized protein FFE2_04240 [Fusarium fujikuroi]SCN97287.1 uncharacterized protein FFC1_07826 [Fusarium fujikuroi]SCO39490.1 uncharacterized protein FFNC_06824 [Fusarium fujikuroi]
MHKTPSSPTRDALHITSTNTSHMAAKRALHLLPSLQSVNSRPAKHIATCHNTPLPHAGGQLRWTPTYHTALVILHAKQETQNHPAYNITVVTFTHSLPTSYDRGEPHPPRALLASGDILLESHQVVQTWYDELREDIIDSTTRLHPYSWFLRAEIHFGLTCWFAE